MLQIRVYRMRFDDELLLNVERTRTGWNIWSQTPYTRKSNKKGEPFLSKELDHHLIEYPKRVPTYMEWLWKKANEDPEFENDGLEAALNELAEWISTVERSRPTSDWAVGC